MQPTITKALRRMRAWRIASFIIAGIAATVAILDYTKMNNLGTIGALAVILGVIGVIACIMQAEKSYLDTLVARNELRTPRTGGLYDPAVNDRTHLWFYRGWRVAAIVGFTIFIGAGIFFLYWRPPGVLPALLVAIQLSLMMTCLFSCALCVLTTVFRIWPQRKELQEMGLLPSK